MKKIFFLSLIALLFSGVDAFAAKRYWVASDPRQWSATSRWAATSGGMSGMSVPGSSDTAYFDGNGVGVCTLNIAVDVKRIEISSGYTGTIVHQGNTITVGTGNAVMSGGTFSGGTAAITFNGSLTISGTAFTSTTSTLTVVGNLTKTSGSFSDNGGTVLFTTTNTIDGSFTFSSLTFTPAAAAIHTIVNTLTVNGTLTLSGSNKLTLNTGTIDTKSTVNISNTGTDGGGSATVKFSGSNNLTCTGNSTIGNGALPKVVIDKSGGTLTLASGSTISVQNDWNYNAGTITYTGSTVAFIDTLTISGANHQLNNVTFQSNADAIYTIGSSTTLTVNGTLATGGSGKLTFNTAGSGVIDAKSHVTLSNTGLGGGGTALITMTGPGSVNLTGNGAVGRSALPKFQINRAATGGAVVIIDTVSAGNNWTWTTGTLTTTNSHVAFLNSCTIAGTHTLNIVTFSNSSSGATYDISNTLTVNGVLSTRGSGTLTFNTGTIDAKSAIKLLNTGTGGGGSAIIKISGNANVTMYGNSTIGQSALPKVTIDKSAGGTLTLSGVISVANNWTRTAGDATPGSSTVAFISALTISGVDTLNNVTFTSNSGSPVAYNLATSAVLRVGGALVFDGTATLYFNTTSGGRIDALGNITIANTGTAGGISPGQTGATLKLIGSGTVNFDSNVSSGKGMLPHVTIDKTGGSVTLLDTISIWGNWDCQLAQDAYLQEGTSTLYFAGSKSVGGNYTLNNLFVDGGTYSMFTYDTTRVTGLLKYVGSTSITINTGTIIAQGNITLANTGTTGGGSGLIFIRGTAVQTFTGVASISNNSLLPNIHIKKSGGSLTLAQVLPVRGSWTYTSGNTIHGTSTVGFTTTKTISGSDTLYNVVFAGAAATFTIQSGTTLYTTGTLSTQGSNALVINTGTIKVLGHITLGNTSTGTGGSATVLIGGSGSQTLTGSGTAGGGALPNVTINASGTLTLASIITCAGNWLYTAGTVAPGTSTVAFAGTYNLDGYEGSGAMPFYNVLIYSGTRTLTDHIDVNNNLTINGSATLDGSSKTINVGGDWNSTGTWTYGTSTVVFDGYSVNKVEGTGTINFATVQISRNTPPGFQPRNLSLKNPVLINTAMTFNKGRIYSTSTNYLAFADNATCTVTNDDSAYVHGPVRKTGNDAFSFPLGDTTLHDSIAYHPLAMTAPGSTGDRFEAQYFGMAQSYGTTFPDSIESISDCEYWTFDRQVGSSTPTLKLAWNSNCPVDNYDDLLVSSWNGSQWNDLGASAVSVIGNTGLVTASVAISFSVNPVPIIIGKSKTTQPYAVLRKKLDGGYYQCSNGKLMFRFDEEYNDPDGKLSFKIYNDNHGVDGSSENVVGGYEPLVNYGSNYYVLNVMSCNLLPDGVLGTGYFILEVVNDKGEHWYLRFKHTTNITVNCPDNGGTE